MKKLQLGGNFLAKFYLKSYNGTSLTRIIRKIQSTYLYNLLLLFQKNKKCISAYCCCLIYNKRKYNKKIKT